MSIDQPYQSQISPSIDHYGSSMHQAPPPKQAGGTHTHTHTPFNAPPASMSMPESLTPGPDEAPSSRLKITRVAHQSLSPSLCPFLPVCDR